ncbi:MAG: metalloregulator ArsR/SmtB family transcription factor [Cocleimonas sp.]|nr:metalloregulator ArsR/SmtB family transcription factor [Cocleimonas sp.]
MEIEQAAKALKELGHPTRLSLFKELVKAGSGGLPVGDIQGKLGIPNSTLSHHISKLITVNLIQQKRDGRTLFCIPQYESLSELIVFLQDECCLGDNANCKVEDGEDPVKVGGCASTSLSRSTL